MNQSSRPVAVVTGASAGGIGSAVALDLAVDHDVIALGRDGRRLRARFPEGSGIRVVELDLLDFAAYESALTDVDRVDVLVHAAAIGTRQSVAETPLSEWRLHFETNLFAPALLTRALIEPLRAAHGDVVFINSGAGARAQPGNTVYSASKFALHALSDGLRAEEAEHRVRVATVSPGHTATAMLERDRRLRGAPWEPEQYIDPASVAAAVRMIVTAAPDAHLTHLNVRPRVEVMS